MKKEMADLYAFAKANEKKLGMGVFERVEALAGPNKVTPNPNPNDNHNPNINAKSEPES